MCLIGRSEANSFSLFRSKRVFQESLKRSQDTCRSSLWRLLGVGGANSGPGHTDWLVLIGSGVSRVELILGQKYCHVPGAPQGDSAALEIPEVIEYVFKDP